MIRLPTLKRVDRLIARHVIGSVLVVWLVLVGFDTVIHLARELGDLNKDYGVVQAVAYIALTVPRRVYEMFGHAALIGSLVGLGGLAASSELTALRASGMSRLRIMLSALGAIAVLLVGVVIIGETLGPAGEQRAQALQVAVRSSGLNLTTRSGLWARDGGDIVNAKGVRTLQKGARTQVRLSDVRIFSIADTGVLQRVVLAATAMSQPGEWRLEDVRITHFDAGGTHAEERATMAWPTRLDARLLELSIVDPAYMALRDLSRNIDYLRANDQNADSYLIAWWGRLFYPLNVLLLVLAVLPMAFGSLRAGGLGKRIFIGVLLAIAWFFLQRALVSVATVYGITAWLANLTPAVLLAILAAIHYRRTA